MRTSFDCAAEFYDRTRGPPSDAMRQLVTSLVNELKGYARVLDVGVGTGRFAQHFQNAGLETVGIDIAGKMLEKAVGKRVKNLLKSDACFLPFRDNAFEASVCIHLLHLITDWQEALREICRVTRDVMLSMIYTSENPVRQTYNRLLAEYGYKTQRLGKGEWELKDVVKPWKSVFACAFDNSADQLIAHLSRRAYSSQWHIPEEVNAKGIYELKQQFSGKMFPAEVRVLVWRIDDLDCCNAYT